MPADAVEVIPDVAIKEADHFQTLTFQVCGAAGVVAAACLGLMDAAVKLDNQPGLWTVEINDVLADWSLPPEAQRVGTQEIVPEMIFLRSHGPAKDAGLITKV
jgi:hypothetical protein